MREKLIELIKEGNGGYDFASVELIADYLIANGVTVQDSKVVDFDQFKQWIPVTERLPEEDDYYLGCVK